MPKFKRCVVCDREFETRFPSAKHCSTACIKADWASRPKPANQRTVVCAGCDVTFETLNRNQRFCSTGCMERAGRAKNRFNRIVPVGAIAPGTLGGLAELLVCVDLMKRGYHVFRSQSQHAPCDLVAFKTGRSCQKIEVKSGAINTTTGAMIYSRPTATQDYDLLAVVTADGVRYDPPLDEEVSQQPSPEGGTENTAG